MSLHCSFCGKTKEIDNVEIYEGAEANICNECVSCCNDAFSEIQIEKDFTGQTFPKPHEIKAELDKYVIGQEEAKKILSVAVYNHYKRVNVRTKIDIQKTNILLIGPTGCGKTYLMQILAKIIDVPIVISDATTLTQAGYIGEDVESVLAKLIKKANGDIKKAEKGIVYIDEIDKLAVKSSSRDTKDPSGEGVQEGLLRLVEDSDVTLSIGGSPHGKKVTINTKNIFFVCGGAFVGLNDIVRKRTSPNKSIGFGVDYGQANSTDKDIEITQQDVVKFGMIEEFVGRFPVITCLKALSKEDLAAILQKPKNSILKQYQALFKIDGVKLMFNQGAIDFIVDEATKTNIGARALKSVIEKRMYDIMFELPKQKSVKTYTVTKELLMSNKI